MNGNNYTASFSPLPQNIGMMLKQKSANFSLAFPRLTTWGEKSGKIETDKTNIKGFCGIANSQFSYPFVFERLKHIHRRQDDFIKAAKRQGCETLTVYAKLASPFISGLGAGHPTETGMILDRNTGIPYVPASSVKGVLRLAYAVSIANGQSSVPDDDAGLVKYFGSTSDKVPARGQVVFLDVYPQTLPQLQQDIMTPHFAKYYGEKRQPFPLETENPVPINFLSVKQDCIFVFRCCFVPVGGNAFTKDDVEAMRKAFAIAFSDIGFGGKTAIGYGRFKELSEEAAMKEEAKAAAQSKPARRNPADLPKPGSQCNATIYEKTKKGKWRVSFDDFPEYKGVVIDSENLSDGAIGMRLVVALLSSFPALPLDSANVKFVAKA